MSRNNTVCQPIIIIKPTNDTRVLLENIPNTSFRYSHLSTAITQNLNDNGYVIIVLFYSSVGQQRSLAVDTLDYQFHTRKKCYKEL